MTPVLPPDHPLRAALDRAMASPAPGPLRTPARAACLLLVLTAGERERAGAALRALAGRCCVPPPGVGDDWQLELAEGRLHWAWGDGFARLTLWAEGAGGPAFGVLPSDWVAGLPGATLLAHEVELAEARPGDPVARAALLFAPEQLAGAAVLGECAFVFSDLRAGPAGTGRTLVLDRQLGAAEAGRLVARLLELEASRALAMLASVRLGPAAAALEEAEAELRTAGGGQARRVLLRAEDAMAEAAPDLRAAREHAERARACLRLLRESRLPSMPTLEERIGPLLAEASSVAAGLARRRGELRRRATGCVGRAGPGWAEEAPLAAVMAAAAVLAAGWHLSPALLCVAAMPMAAAMVPVVLRLRAGAAGRTRR